MTVRADQSKAQEGCSVSLTIVCFARGEDAARTRQAERRIDALIVAALDEGAGHAGTGCGRNRRHAGTGSDDAAALRQGVHRRLCDVLGSPRYGAHGAIDGRWRGRDSLRTAASVDGDPDIPRVSKALTALYDRGVNIICRVDERPSHYRGQSGQLT